MSNGPVEPSAHHRMFALQMRQMFLALIAEGFTDKQALSIIAEIIGAIFGGAASV